MAKIIGNTTATPNPRPDWEQTDETKADFIKNKPTLGSLATKSTVSKTDLESTVQTSLGKADSAVLYTAQTLTDAQKAQARANIGAGESGFSGDYNDLKNKPTIPSSLSDLTADETHRTVADEEKAVWNAKSDFSGSYTDLTNKPTIPAKTSELTNDSDFATNASVDEKITNFTTSSSVNNSISTHNTSTSAHNDIRELITNLTTRLNALADSDDTTLDQMSEIVAYIKANKSLIDSITTDKVNVADIVNNLTTNVANKPLSAAQGVAIKTLIDALQAELDSHTHTISDVSGLQSALDGKAASSHGTHVTYSTTVPVMDGTASAGSASTVARSDHKHPTDTSRASKTEFDTHTGNKSNPHGVTAAQTGALPLSGGTMTGTLVVNGGDAVGGSKISFETGKGQITNSSTGTLFGYIADSTLAAGHSSSKLELRGSTSKPTYNGNEMALMSDLKEAYLQWGGKNIVAGASPIDAALNDEMSANRLAFMPAKDITVEYSTDGGSTWIDYGLTDSQKQSLVTTEHAVYVGKKTNSKATVNDKLRITIAASEGYTYFMLRKIQILASTGGATGTTVHIERAMRGSETTFSTVATYDIGGWSGWNIIPYEAAFGGSLTSNTGILRFTFSLTGVNSQYNSNLLISKIRMFGETSWGTAGGSIADNGHMYSYDINKNVTFPAAVSGAEFIGSLRGGADSARKLDSSSGGTSGSQNNLIWHVYDWTASGAYQGVKATYCIVDNEQVFNGILAVSTTTGNTSTSLGPKSITWLAANTATPPTATLTYKINENSTTYSLYIAYPGSWTSLTITKLTENFMGSPTSTFVNEQVTAIENTVIVTTNATQATSATKATQDANGNNIVDTYMQRKSYERIENGKNLNDYHKAGFYNVKTQGVLNCPEGIDIDAALLVYPWNSEGYELQEITETAASSTTRRWVRRCYGDINVWSPWKAIISEENISSYIDTAIAEAITYGTDDLIAGESALATGTIYLVYE